MTIAVVTSTVFLARLYGVALAPGQLAAVAASSVLLSFSVPGVPGGVILVIAPVLASVGIPAEGVGVLLAIDVIPDMFRTLTNVTADAAGRARFTWKFATAGAWYVRSLARATTSNAASTWSTVARYDVR